MASFGIYGVAIDLPKRRMDAEEIARHFGVGLDVITNQLSLSSKSVAVGADEHPSNFAVNSARKVIIETGVDPKDIGLVIYTGVSRDYLPSWSVAIEIIGRLKLPNAIGFDMTIGCSASILALNIATRMTNPGKGPVTLICAAERWADTVSKDVAPHPLATLAHGDGGAACLLGPGGPGRVGLVSGISLPDFNEYLLIPCGGTAEPLNENSFQNKRHIKRTGKIPGDGSTDPTTRRTEAYVESYKRVIHECLAMNKMDAVDFLVTNGVRVKIRQRIAEHFHVPLARVPTRYETLGHLGTADLFLALEMVWRNLKAGSSVTCSASTAAQYCAAPVLFEN